MIQIEYLLVPTGMNTLNSRFSLHEQRSCIKKWEVSYPSSDGEDDDVIDFNFKARKLSLPLSEIEFSFSPDAPPTASPSPMR